MAMMLLVIIHARQITVNLDTENKFQQPVYQV
jgi:hypothetical protein